MLLPKSLLIKIAREVDRPALRKELEKFWQGFSFFILAMVVRAVQFFATLGLALLHLVVFWMENILLPAMGFLAKFASITRVFVIGNRLVLVPFFTALGLIKVEFVLAPVVLPVVSVHASIPLMSFLVIRTPHRLEVKHVEVFVSLKLVNQINRNFIVTVGE